jgi:hypothetical protein
MKTLSSTLAALALLAGCGEAEKPAAPAPAPTAPAPATAGGYPLATCVVSDEKLGSMGDPVVIRHEGTEVRLCCAACEKGFRKDPAKYLAKIEAAKKGK